MPLEVLGAAVNAANRSLDAIDDASAASSALGVLTIYWQTSTALETLAPVNALRTCAAAVSPWCVRRVVMIAEKRVCAYFSSTLLKKSRVWP